LSEYETARAKAIKRKQEMKNDSSDAGWGS
jgi:hypothetical protein